MKILVYLQIYDAELSKAVVHHTAVLNYFWIRDAFQKKNYVDRETAPKEGRGLAPFPYKNPS